MQEKHNVTGMTCATCQAKVQKSVSNLTGVQECNVNLLKNSMVVTYDDKNVNSGQIIAAVEKAGLWHIPTAGQGKISCTGGLPGGHGEKGINKSRRKSI